MHRYQVALLLAAGGLVSSAGMAIAPRVLNAQQPVAHHPVPATKNGNVVVMLCDGKTSLEIKGLKPGHTMTHDQATAVARQLMQKWQRAHPGELWQMAQEEGTQMRPTTTEQGNPSPNLPSAPNQPPSGEAPNPVPHPANPVQEQVQGVPVHRQAQPQQQGDTYASFNQRDFRVWQAETQKFVEYGKRVFHSDKLLGGTIGVSCDMCHPDAANTHPETYPKYQVQLQRVALLRDMIEWCIENPVKGATMSPNDPRLRALEAYILAQRKGVPLNYGKH